MAILSQTLTNYTSLDERSVCVWHNVHAVHSTPWIRDQLKRLNGNNSDGEQTHISEGDW